MKENITFSYGKHQVTLESGEIARQADGAVMVNMEGTVVLVTAVAKKTVAEGQDFFPLTVDYQEKSYAAGRIPGGYFRREGRPSENETLVSRLIDRPLRPLFPEGFFNEVQVIASVMSVNPDISPDIPAMIGASAAIALSGVPFNGPIGAARVGYKNGAYLLNPSDKELQTSDLDLVVAGTEGAVLMVESQANELPEDVMLGAVMYGHEQMQVVINAIRELAAKAGKPAWDWQPAPADEALIAKVRELAHDKLVAAYQIADKQERQAAVAAVHEAAQAALVSEEGWNAAAVGNTVHDLEYRVVRDRILAKEPRIDGRDTVTVRPITIRTGVLPRVHGSALFTRGETQALVVATLGTGRDAQIIDALPKLMPYALEFDPEVCITLAVVFPMVAIQVIGDVSAACLGSIDRMPTERELSGAIVSQGLTSMVGGLLGGLPTSALGQNVGIICSNKVVNKWVFVIIAAVFAIAGLFPQLSAVLSAIPQPVIGGATVGVFGTITMNGVRMFTREGLTQRTTTIVGTSVVFGLGIWMASGCLAGEGMPAWVSTVIGSNAVTPTAIMAIVLNLILPQTPVVAQHIDAAKDAAVDLVVPESKK